MPTSKGRAKKLTRRPYEDQHAAYIGRRSYFPKGSMDKLVRKLGRAHGADAPSIKTVRAILSGYRKDNYGVMELYVAVTTANEEKIRKEAKA